MLTATSQPPGPHVRWTVSWRVRAAQGVKNIESLDDMARVVYRTYRRAYLDDLAVLAHMVYIYKWRRFSFGVVCHTDMYFEKKNTIIFCV